MDQEQLRNEFKWQARARRGKLLFLTLNLQNCAVLVIVIVVNYSSYQKHAPHDDIFSISNIKFSGTSIKCFHDEFNCRQENGGVVMETFD